jgi:hypothetical protein
MDARFLPARDGRAMKSNSGSDGPPDPAVVPSDLRIRPRAREENRTPDLRITSALLCRLSYSGGTSHDSSGLHEARSRLTGVVSTTGELVVGAGQLHRAEWRSLARSVGAVLR